MYSFNEADLTKEKSLWDVYKLARKIRPSNIQIVLVLVSFTALSINAFFLSTNTEVILSDVRKWAETGFSFAITILGFLIAGFTIFATLSKPRMMLAMMDHTNTETGLPTLKYNFFAFMKVFIAYISFLLLYAAITLFGQKDGLLSNIINFLPNSDCTQWLAINMSYAVVGSSFIYLLLLLKSFIFNIYAIVMNMLRWEYHQEEDRANGKEEKPK